MSDTDNELHDIHPKISFADLEEIDLEPVQDLPLTAIADHIRGLASKASVGQLRQILEIKLDDQDYTREELIEKFTQNKMKAVIKIKQLIEGLN